MLIDDLSVVEDIHMVAEVEEQAVELRQESLDEGLLLSPTWEFPISHGLNCWMISTIMPMLELGHSTVIRGGSRGKVPFIYIRHRTEIWRKVKPFVEHASDLMSKIKR